MTDIIKILKRANPPHQIIKCEMCNKKFMFKDYEMHINLRHTKYKQDNILMLINKKN